MKSYQEVSTILEVRDARFEYESLMRRFSNYSPSDINKNVTFRYLSKDRDDQLQKLYCQYGLSRYQKEQNDVDVFLKVLRWSHEILDYEVQKKYTGVENATDIIEFCIKEKATVNCRQHAIVLTEALLAMGYCARLVCCLPIDILPQDYCSMTVVYSNNLKKWIALDPSRNCCFLDREGLMLSVEEIRQYLVKGQKIYFKYFNRFNTTDELMLFDDVEYLDYLYKNFFRFLCSKMNGTTNNMPRIYYHLVPTGYLVVDYKPVVHDGNIILMNTDDSRSFWDAPNYQ